MFDQQLTAAIAEARQQGVADLVRRSALRTPDHLALVHRDRRTSYAELDEVTNRAANALTARGVGKGDRIALLAHNHHDYVVACLALARIGAIAVPVNFMLQASEVGYILEHSGATGAIVEDALVEVMTSAVSEVGAELGLRAVIGDPVEGWEPFAGLAGHPDAAAPEVAVADDDVVQLMYTSGTESRPKGAMMTSRSLVQQYVSCIVDGDYAADDVEIHALPLFHVAAQHCFLMPGLYVGATNVILDGPDPSLLLQTVAEAGVTKMFCPPTVWIALLRHPDFDPATLSSLRKGYYGASIMPVEVIKELQERLPEMALYNYYGQTEMSALALVLKPDEQVRKAGAAGRPALNVETMLVDGAGVRVGPGVEGEIVHRSPHATLGYWQDPEKTAAAYEGGWFHSGDLGVMDEDGYITVVDRKKDMIKTGGENVASREVEEVLHQHAAVAETAVFGVPHPEWIEAVAAVVVPRDGATVTAEELIGHCRERLAGYKTPKYVVLAEDLPKNASGKILKRDLRTTHADLAG